MNESIYNKNDSKMCKYKRTDSRGIWQYLKDKSEKCTFHRATKLYLEYFLGGVESIPYHLGDIFFNYFIKRLNSWRIGHYSTRPVIYANLQLTLYLLPLKVMNIRKNYMIWSFVLIIYVLQN